ncbi:MAG: TonB-dependent receptor [Candidatus Zixiibacteriota bacterium]|nr:MAG: TonB-dependent receptor [candidate division Zixibacteria bacterium]
MRSPIFGLLLLVIASGFAPARAEEDQSYLKGKIEGTIVDRNTGEALAGASIYLVNRFGGAIADEEGHFVISGLKPEVYALSASHVGYLPGRVDSIMVVAGESIQLSVELDEKIHHLKGITVTPGHFTIMGTEAVASQTLSRRELETTPQVGEDLYRAVKRLPGVSAEDFSSRFYVRGGEHEEVLVTLDGVQLYEPFHLKDFKGGLFSAIDGSSVESIELITGGFTAQYGDRSSGVFNITSHRPPTGERKVAAAVSLMNARFMTEGTFADNRGSWMISARRGYLDVLLKIAGEGDKLRPTYYDLLSKVQYQLGANQILSGHFFHAGDRFKVIENDDNDADTVITSYDNTYGWLNLKSQLHPRLLVQTVLSIGQVSHDRYGYSFWSYEQLEDGRATDIEKFTVLGLKSDWEYELSDSHLLKAGIDGRKLKAEYDYLGTDHVYYTLEDGSVVLERIDTVQNSLNPSGNQLGAYLSHRVRVSSPLTFELGVRFDRHSYTNDEHFSPRFNFIYQLGENTALRGAWGHFYQAQRIDELFPGDNLTEFYPAELAEHKTVGLEHDFGTGIRLRLEAYHKKYSDLRPEPRNTFDDMQAFPEYEDDRIIVYRDESVARGFEVFLKREKGSKFTWWASYAYARVEDQINRIHYSDGYNPDGVDVVYNSKFPNPHDQRHTVYLDVSYRPTLRWQLNLAWHYNTGWPYTGVELRSAVIDGETVVWINQGETLAQRYPDYSRLDFRINRYFDFWGGRLTAFLEVINILGRENVRCYNYSIRSSSSGLYIDSEVEPAFPTLPVLGVMYSINM